MNELAIEPNLELVSLADLELEARAQFRDRPRSTLTSTIELIETMLECRVHASSSQI